MAELMQENWIFFLIALVIGILVAWWLFAASRKTRVQADPERAAETDAPAKRNQALIDAAPAASANVVEVPKPVATVAEPVPVATVPVASEGDDLTRIKGVGPKLAEQLRALGVTSYEQIAGWDDAEIDRIDAQLGRFQGRIRRDNWTEQARFLASGDMTGFEGKFGKV